MAATDPPESPPKRPKSPSEEAEPSGPGKEAACTDGEATPKAPQSLGGERTEATAGSGDGRDGAAGRSPEDAGKTTDTPGDDGWGFDWSETEEEGTQPRGERRENDRPGAAEEARGDAGPREKRRAGEAVDGVEKEVAGIDRDGEQDADAAAKPKKACLLCKDCGMVFNRRETFNLHRHFHAHQDELSPLTCRECGLTFQQRSGLVKHRNEHKEKEEPLLTPKKEPPSEEGSFKCAECEVVFYTVDSLRAHSCCGAVEKPYHCPLCRQEFQFKVSVSKHMISHSQECVFKCQECSQTFPDNLALRYHQRCHTALKPYKCPECGLVFKHYSVMEDHRRKHTASARSHLCNICGKAFKYGSLLHQHQYLHTGQKPFRCPECGKKFAFAQNMKAHCRQHRLNQGGPSGEPPGGGPAMESARQQSEEAKRTFKCPTCPQTFAAAVNLTAHMIIHEAESEKLERKGDPAPDAKKYWDKGHCCTHCPCVFRDEKSLNSHLLSSHKCIAQYLENVGAPAKQAPQANAGDAEGKWRPDGAGARSYRCPECGKAFRFRSVLELHMRMHSKDKPYQCKVCSKSFRFSSYLQQHVIIHTGKKPHKCPDCGKDFAFLQNMRTHQRLHQEKPFRCSSCRKGYSDEAQLQRHMLSHNGDKPHKCGLCSKSFGLAYLLRDHMNTHTGERPHRCDECHKSFSWFSSLLVHRKIHARKRQGFSQGGSSPAGGRMKGRGSRGRQAWGSPRQPGSGPQPSVYPAPSRREQDPEEARRPKEPIQWKVDGGEVMPVSSSPPLHARSSEPSESKESPPSSEPALPGGTALKKPSPALPAQSRQLKTLALSTTASGALLVSGLAQQVPPAPSFADGGGARPTPPPKKDEGKARDAGEQHVPSPIGQSGAPGPVGAPASSPADQSGVAPAPAPVPLGGGTTLWAIQAPPGLQYAEKSANQDLLKQLSAGWVSLQSPAGTQKVPIALPFGQAVGTPVWGFQSNPVAQALLAAQLKPANGQELQQQPLVTGTQIIINQGAPFLSTPLAPLSLHSVPVGALTRPSHPKIFFAPQAVMVERPPVPQTTPLPQTAPQTEPQKPGARMPVAPDRLLQCMICGCSLPRELDLQLHYLQHAQGEI